MDGPTVCLDTPVGGLGSGWFRPGVRCRGARCGRHFGRPLHRGIGRQFISGRARTRFQPERRQRRPVEVETIEHIAGAGIAFGKRFDVIVKAAPLIPDQKERCRLPLRPVHHRVQNPGSVVFSYAFAYEQRAASLVAPSGWNASVCLRGGSAGRASAQRWPGCAFPTASAFMQSLPYLIF
jgi:hypothetical protein